MIVPWETIVKRYRAHLGRRSFRRVAGYGVDFLNFVEGNSAFQEWVERYTPDFSAVVREESKGSLLGIGVFVRNAQGLGIGE